MDAFSGSFRDKLGLPKMPDYSGASKSEGIQHTGDKGLIAPAFFLAVWFLPLIGLRNESKTE